MFKQECYATIGRVSNSEIYNVVLGKAGRKRWLGVRPSVRGSVMNQLITLMEEEKEMSNWKPRPLTPWGNLL